MDSPSKRMRFATLLLGGSILATAAAVLFRPESDGKPAEQASTAAAPTSQQFDQWVERDTEAARGPVVGVVEKNGEMVEVRQAPADENVAVPLDPAAADEADIRRQQDLSAPR